MIDVRIVCTHDAIYDPLKTAETIARLLEAEEHQVRLVYGRQSLAELDVAKAARDAVMLIWSPDAPSQHYMLEWARHIHPLRLVEIARAPGWPRIERTSAVIDFSSWRGDRGARAWGQLKERLRAVARDLEPAKPPPKQAAMALGMAGLAAVTAAVMVRATDTQNMMPGMVVEAPAMNIANVQEVSDIPLGGPIALIEPASVEDLEPVEFIAPSRFTPLEISTPDLVELSDYTPPEIRSPSIIERIIDLNPLRADNAQSPDEGEG